ncbi:hypothetical protein L249_2299 [Ophiocordyceps polyrhachis-furcata BCC 54312]|uniref:Flavodoxin-like domain-containing protein n=1 Tax=Ophiocordyceps polyrhachis-furcata BCC 54312 TaxID=1330021 RepID=A0A367LPR6_9HYPO|nr:hypothetical protein L249_2299 [Ophiocordyceps polyrhachis-furcata BCC 54312]
MSLFQLLLALLIPLQLTSSALTPPPPGHPPRPPPAIFILSSTESRWATKAVADALHTLGFTETGPANSYRQIERDDSPAWQRLASSMPHARFILPAAAGAASDHDDVRRFFDVNHPHQLLELFVGTTVPAEQAENWVTLCRFLGLGYSVVERLKLWYFPAVKF